MVITNNDCKVDKVPKDFLKCSTLESNKKNCWSQRKGTLYFKLIFVWNEQEGMEILENTGISFDTKNYLKSCKIK